MKKWILLALLVLVVYSSYTLFIKVTHFTTEKASFEYNAGGLDALADSLSTKKIIRDKTSFLVLSLIIFLLLKLSAKASSPPLLYSKLALSVEK